MFKKHEILKKMYTLYIKINIMYAYKLVLMFLIMLETLEAH